LTNSRNCRSLSVDAKQIDQTLDPQPAGEASSSPH
jgi:hypothetical protein